MQTINTQDFKQKVFDFTAGKEWKFAGQRPCIVDFSASWCGPCRMLAPVLEQVSAEYAGKLDVYKVDIDQEAELAAAFGIQSVPTLIFIPLTGQPAAASGAMPKESLVKAINEHLGVS